MNLKRGLWRLWVVLAVLWLAGAFYMTGKDLLSCLVARGPWCDYRGPEYYAAAVLVYFGPPIAVLSAAWIAIWVKAGFSSKKS